MYQARVYRRPDHAPILYTIWTRGITYTLETILYPIKLDQLNLHVSLG